MVNMFPKANSIGGVSPKELFTGIKIDYKREKSCKLGFGEYAQVYAEHDITNTAQDLWCHIIGSSCKFSRNIPVHELADVENDQAQNVGRDAAARRAAVIVVLVIHIYNQ